MKKMNGFTLLELMITLAFLAIITAIALPSFTTMFEDNRVATQTNALIGGLMLARSEAIVQGVPVVIRAGENGTGASFNEGWCIYAMTGATPPPVCGTTTVVRHGGLKRVSFDGGSVIQVTFDRLGRMIEPVTNVTFTIKPPACSNVNDTTPGGRARQLTINNMGRTQAAQQKCS